MKFFYWAVLVSVVIHLLQVAGLYFASIDGLKMKQAPEVVEIEFVQKPDLDQNKPIVRSLDTPEVESDRKADFFAERKIRVQKQTQVLKKGVAQQGSQIQKLEQPKQFQQKKFEFENAVSKPDESGLNRTQTQSQWRFNSTQNPNQTSQFEYALPRDVEFGDVTALDTDAHLFASFYNRVVDLFYIRWVQRLDQIWDRLPFEQKKKLTGQIWTSEIEVILNTTGIYQTSRLLKKSGFEPFDQALIYAFKSAQVFPNPPKDKFESDGTVRMKFRVGVSIF